MIFVVVVTVVIIIEGRDYVIQRACEVVLGQCCVYSEPSDISNVCKMTEGFRPVAWNL